jgi:hypothetical protein
MSKIIIHNAETNEISERKMTKDELDDLKKINLDAIALKEEEATKATEKAALLAKLGITQEEAALLLGGN